MKTEILFICGVFARENEPEVMEWAKKSVEFSANQMQLKLIEGIKSVAHTQVVSAPFIGHYPNQSNCFYFRKFKTKQSLYDYVSFNNVFGIKNLSRANSLKKKIYGFAKLQECRKLIVVFSAHDPFLSAAAYAKKIDPSIKVCFIIPDLPQYMNLETGRKTIYDFLKKYDIKLIKKHMQCVDSSVVLTKSMAKEIGLDHKPYIVKEGIIDNIPKENEYPKAKGKKDTVGIIYAGKLYFKFGMKQLVNAFGKIEDENYRLILCGNGDAVDYIKKAAQQDERIIFTGQISPDKVKEYIKEADVLINPRPNNEEYTKYSFPSKDIEYLLSCNAVVAYMLDGMPKCYKDFIYEIQGDMDETAAIKAAIKQAAAASEEEKREKYSKFIKYVSKNLMANEIAQEIIEISFGQETQ